MNNNLVPALIIAVAILAGSLLPRFPAPNTLDHLLDQLGEAGEKKDSAGDTKLSKILKGLSRSVSDGIAAGFSGNTAKDKEKLAIRDQIVISEVKIAPGRQSNDEKAIGIVKNTSGKTIKDVSLNVIFKDAAGGLKDVSTQFTRVEGMIKPGQQLGLEAEHKIGDFQDKKEVLDQNRSASAVVSIVDFTIIQ